jgi:hypothetical protein
MGMPRGNPLKRKPGSSKYFCGLHWGSITRMLLSASAKTVAGFPVGESQGYSPLLSERMVSSTLKSGVMPE